jgi:hypothetical protein
MEPTPQPETQLCHQCKRPLDPKEKPGQFEDHQFHRKCLDQFLLVKDRRRFARTFFLPFLIENTASVEEAKILCQALSVSINQAFNNRKATMKVESLKLLGMLNPEVEQYEKYKKIFKVLGKESVAEALIAIDDMQNAIGARLQQKEKDQTLQSLNLEILE